MANVTLNNTALIPGGFHLGVNNPDPMDLPFIISDNRYVSSFSYYQKPSYTETVDYALVVDLNKDGIDEVIFYGLETPPNTPANYDNTSIKVFGWQGGVFQEITQQWMPFGINLVEGVGEISAGDFNNDGHLDLFASGNASTEYLVNAYAYINQGSSFQKVLVDENVKWQIGSTVYDLNKDGFADVIASSYDGPRLYMGSVSGLTPKSINVGIGGDVVAGNFAPGKTMIVGLDTTLGDVRSDNSTFEMKFNPDGTVGFESKQTLESSDYWNSVGKDAHSIRGVAFDYTSDGFDDLLIVTVGPMNYGQKSDISFYKNDGTGVFSLDRGRIEGYSHDNGSSYRPVIADFNDDGRVDIFISESTWQSPTNSTAFLIQGDDGIFRDTGRHLFNSTIGEGDFATVAKGPGGELHLVQLKPEYLFGDTNELTNKIHIAKVSFDTIHGTVGQTLSHNINTFHNAYKSIASALSQGAGGWRVDDASVVPAGAGASLTKVDFVNTDGQEFSLMGTLVNTGSTFKLTGSSVFLKQGDQEFDLKLSANWSIDFWQRDTGKTYETQLNFYSGDISQARTTVGSLPNGGVVTAIEGGGLPSAFNLMGLEAPDGSFTWMGGAFTGTVNGITGNLQTVRSIVATESGDGAEMRTWNVASGAFQSGQSSSANGIFTQPAASVTLASVARSEGPVSLNFNTLLPDMPATGVSTVGIASPTVVPMSTPYLQKESVMFGGNDTFNTTTSNTDSVVMAGAGNDVVNAGAGFDIIHGGVGNDSLNGGAGNDTFLVDQNEGFGPVNLSTHAVASLGGYKVFTQQLGHDVINGGAGLDTVMFAPPDVQWETGLSTTPPAAAAPTIDPNLHSFKHFGRVQEVSLVGFSNKLWTVDEPDYVQANRFKVAILELRPIGENSQSKKLVAFDLETQTILAQRNMATNEQRLRSPWNEDTQFFTQSLSADGKSLTIQSFDYSLAHLKTATNLTAQSTRTFTFDEPLRGYFDEFIGGTGSEDWFGSFGIENSTIRTLVIYQFKSNGSFEKINIPSQYTSSAEKYHWVDNTFIQDNALWVKANSNYVDGSSSWTQNFIKYDLSSKQWSGPIDPDQFWDAKYGADGRDSVIRFGSEAIDTKSIGIFDDADVKQIYELTPGKYLVQLNMESPAGQPDPYEIGYERWAVIDQSGVVAGTDVSFMNGAGIGLRSINEVDDGHFYFQVINSVGGFGSNGVPTQANAGTAVSLYRIPLNQVEAALQSYGSQNKEVLDTSTPGVQLVANYTKQQLIGSATGKFAVIEQYVPPSNVAGGLANGIALLIGSDIDFAGDKGTLYVNRVGVDGRVLSSQKISSSGDAWIEDQVSHAATGEFYYSLGQEVAGKYSQQFFVLDLKTGTSREISSNTFELAQDEIPPTVLSQQEVQTDLQLVLPSAYYGKLLDAQWSNSKFQEAYKATGDLLGVQSDLDRDNKTVDYFQIKAPDNGSIGLIYKNSHNDQDEYIQLKDVEYIELMGVDGELKAYDIRPLYLASSGADTLYAFKQSDFQALVNVFNNTPGEPTQSPTVYDDPMQWYRNNFAVFTPEGGYPEWRYYLNAGAGADTLHGTHNEGDHTAVQRIQFDGDAFKGSVTFKLTHSMHNTETVSIVKKPEWGFGDFNRAIATAITQLNIGVVAQQGKNTRELVFSDINNDEGLWDSNVGWNGWKIELATDTAGVRVYKDFIHEKGRDVLDGGAGNDVMIGYSGNDSYYVDAQGDRVIESSWDQGFDQVLTNTNFELARDSAVERMVVHQVIADLGGYLFIEPRATEPALASKAVNLTGNDFTYELLGHDGSNIIRAGQHAGLHGDKGDNRGALMLGLGGNDQLFGSGRDDHLFGGAGNDTLTGGLGDDRFYMGFQLANGTVANALLPSYTLLSTYGFQQDTANLTGGNDTAFGGDGFDVVVVGAKSGVFPGMSSEIWFQRESNTEIQIFTLADSMRVDSSMEAVTYYTSAGAQTLLLPWVVSMNERDRMRHYDAHDDKDMAYAAPSAFNDLLDLSTHPASLTPGVMTSFDAGAGDDVIHGGGRGESTAFSTIRGGAGNDWVYNGRYTHEFGGWRYELYGDAGNDTLTFHYSDMAVETPGDTAQVLLDGGVDNDHYRLSVNDWQQGSDKTHVRIEDAGGVDRLTLAVQDGDQTRPDIYVNWDSGELRFFRVDRDVNFNITERSVMMSAAIGAIDQLFITSDDEYFDGDLFAGGNLVNPTAALTSGKMVGTAGNDVLLPINGMRLEYDAGAGDDLIVMNDIKGGIVSGGADNNKIQVERLYDNVLTELTLSYAWTPAGAQAEIDLGFGYAVVVNAAGGLLGTDAFEAGPFVHVLGGAGNETIRGSNMANRLDGAAGDDVLFSGQNSLSHGRDVLIGGLGNDILVEEAHWGDSNFWRNHDRQGSLLEGGAGHDVYVIAHNGSPPTSGPNGWVTPTKIVERNANGSDSGGVDTIRFVSDDVEPKPSANFIQVGNVIRVEAPYVRPMTEADLRVGDVVILGFSPGPTGVPNPTQSNGYAVTRLVTEVRGGIEYLVAVEFVAPNAANQSGQVVVREPGMDAMAIWADANTLALFNPDGSSLSAISNVASGQNMIQAFDGNRLQTDLSVTALIDRNAMDMLEIGASDALIPGLKMGISFNQGKSASLELVMAGSNGNAVLYGGAGSDYIVDTSYRDILMGGDGHDVLVSNFGSDVAHGGAGNDLLVFRADGQVLVGGSGADTFVVKGMGQGPATITDFKPWEGDRLVLDDDWLDNLGNQTNWDMSTLNLGYNESQDTIDFYMTYQLNVPSSPTYETQAILSIVGSSGAGDKFNAQMYDGRTQLDDSLYYWKQENNQMPQIPDVLLVT